MVSKASPNTPFQPPHCEVTGMGYLHSVVEECASIVILCPFIKDHSSGTMSKHNLSSKVVVQNVSEVPVKPPSYWGGRPHFILAVGKGGREIEPDDTTEQINSEGEASGGEQHIRNTIMAEWVKD